MSLSWADLGPSLGGSWPVLGRLAAVLAALGVVLGGLGAIFGWSWGGLGRSDRNRSGQKIHQKSDQHLRWPPKAILNRFWVVWGSILAGFGIDLDGFGIDLRRFFVDFFWRARFDAKKCATSVPKVVSKM